MIDQKVSLIESNIIDKLKKYRMKKGYSQGYISDKLGIAQSTYNKLENFQISLKVKTLLKIMHVLDITMNDIISSEGDIEIENPKRLVPNNNSSESEFLFEIINELKEQIRILRESRQRRGEKINELRILLSKLETVP